MIEKFRRDISLDNFLSMLTVAEKNDMKKPRNKPLTVLALHDWPFK